MLDLFGENSRGKLAREKEWGRLDVIRYLFISSFSLFCSPQGGRCSFRGATCTELCPSSLRGENGLFVRRKKVGLFFFARM